MQINKIAGANIVLGAPSNWDHTKTECGGLPARIEMDENGQYYISEWQPTEEELERLKKGQPVHLWIWGKNHPVVGLTVGYSEDEINNKKTEK